MAGHATRSAQTSSTVVLLRHGESQANADGIFSGMLDVRLTDNGRRQAVEAGALLGGFGIDMCYTSELRRAFDTADLALGAAKLLNVPQLRVHALNERSYGQLEGLKWTEAVAKFGEEAADRWVKAPAARPPGGMTLSEKFDEVRDAFMPILANDIKAHRTPLVVAHAGSLKGVIAALERSDHAEAASARLPNCRPVVYEVDPESFTVASIRKL